MTKNPKDQPDNSTEASEQQVVPDPTLFVGGTHDGKRLVVNEMRSIELPEFREPSGPTPYDQHRTFKTEVYELSRLAGNSKQFTVYLLSGLTADELMSRLIDHYKSE